MTESHFTADAMDSVEEKLSKSVEMLSNRYLSKAGGNTPKRRERSWAAFCEIAQDIIDADQRLTRKALGIAESCAVNGSFGIWAGSMAGHARNTGDVLFINYGLVSLALSNSRHGHGSSFVQLCLLCHAATALGYDFGELTAELANIYPIKFRNHLAEFLETPAEERTLEAIGFCETVGPMGLSYTRDHSRR